MKSLFCPIRGMQGSLVFLILLFFFFPILTYSQSTFTIKGAIIDELGQPVEGVSVAVKNTRAKKGYLIKTVSDSTGTFSIPVSAGGSLIFLHPGFYNVELKIKSQSQLAVQLTAHHLQSTDNIRLLSGREVAIDNQIQSFSTIYHNQLKTTPGGSYLKALPGRLPGLYVQQNSGQPELDGALTLDIRGQPALILIDGIPRSFSSIEPESIESVTVLKDALSTVLFGQRSSNGMLLINTKKGFQGAPRISFTAETGSQRPLNLPKPVAAADYAILYNEALKNENKEPIYSDAAIEAYRSGSNPYMYPDVDWRNTLLKDHTSINRYNLNMEGGGTTARYFVSLDYLKAGGILKTADFNPYNTNADLNRYIIRSNVNIDFNKSLNMELNLFGRILDGNQPGSTAGSLLSAMLVTPNNAYPQLNPNGSLAGNRSFTNNLYGQSVYSGYKTSYTRDLSTDLQLTKKLNSLLDGLWLKGNLSFTSGLNQEVDRSKTFAVYNMQVSPTGDTAYQQSGIKGQQKNTFAINSRLKSTYTKLSLGYDHQRERSGLNLLLLVDRQSLTTDLDLPANYTNFAGSASYNYDKKYFAEVATSYGGLNRYKTGNRFGVFYAFGLGWNIGDEEFLKDRFEWMDHLKLRASYGKTGNANIGYFVYNNYFSNQPGYVFGTTATAASGFSEVSTFANPNATWEKANKINIGLDAGLFNNRLKVTADWFDDRYYDLMQKRGNSPDIIGRVYPQENIGVNCYSGPELSVSYQNNIRGFKYFITANGSVLKSTVIDQDEVFRKYDWMERTGEPVGQQFGLIAEGLFQSQAEINNSPRIDGYIPLPGDIKYRDLNNDGVINDYDETAIGSAKPLIYYGTTFGFSIKGFDLSISFQGAANRSIFLSGNSEWEFQNNGYYQAFEHHLNRWTPATAQTASYPRLSIGTNINNQRVSSYWLKSGDYLRLQNLDIGYNLPYMLINRLRLKGLRIFVNGLNLLILTSQDQVDPEAITTLYPIQKIVNAGVNIKF